MQPIILLLLMFGIFYFLMIRPENKRKKRTQQMLANLKKGDKIVTIGGVIGVIVHLEKDSVVIETSDDRVRMHFTKWAVSSLVDDPDGKNTAKKKDEKAETPAEIPQETNHEETDKPQPAQTDSQAADQDDKNK